MNTPTTDRGNVMNVRRALLVGVSYLIPFVAVGGVLMALGQLLGGRDIESQAAVAISTGATPSLHYVAAVLFTLGSLSFGLLTPVLAGYIAFAIAGRPGIMPGFTTGLAAGAIGAGFPGGLVGGLLAGYVTEQLLRRVAPDRGRGPMAILVVPLLATLVAGGAMLALLGRPLAYLETTLNARMTDLSGTSAVLLGAVLGAMIVVDLGGPINKVAYTFATGAVAAAPGDTGALELMAAVMIAGMTAPLALWLASTVRPAAFTEAERVAGPTAGVLGALFITEGAIPFVATDALRVLPSIVLGGAVAGASSMAFHVTLDAPHGGLLALFAVGHVAWFLVSLVLGTLTSATAVLVTKQSEPVLSGELVI